MRVLAIGADAQVSQLLSDLAIDDLEALIVADTLDQALDQSAGFGSRDVGREADLLFVSASAADPSGLTAVTQVRAIEQLRPLPLLVVVGGGEPSQLAALLEAGATDWIVAPRTSGELLARLATAVRHKHEVDQSRINASRLVERNKGLRKAIRELRLRATHDGLTGILNRRELDRIMHVEWRRAIRSGAPLALLLFDVDHFKLFNDTYGHQAGDACLRQVATALSQSLTRAGDVAARYGGEEFTVVLPATDLAGALKVAEKLRARIEELGIPHRTSRVADHVTVSVGVAATLARESDLDVLLEATDRSLYRAKAAGRNRVGTLEDATDSAMRATGVTS
ncbi:MAG: diguanylate cyclase [Chloroflexi bacterium]|nr:diguanylate cyclase [Chloroflexota bacterium]